MSTVDISRGIYLGRGRNGDAFSGSQRSTLVLGPTRSGKTSSLIIPNLLMTASPSIITSTKDDVLREMIRHRRTGASLLFDPSGTVDAPAGVLHVGFSPLRQSRSWDGALLATRTILDVQRRAARDADHWTERAVALLAPLLHAGALADEGLAHLARRVDTRSVDDYRQLLTDTHGKEHSSVHLLESVLTTEERERSSIWSTASGLLAGMRTDAARHAARRAPVDLEEFLSGPHQLHVVSPSRHQSVVTPLIVGMIEEVVQASYASSNQRGLFLALDELANVAPLPRLASIVSEGGGLGVVTLACLQDLSQARARWGVSAEGFISLFPTTVVLPGIADRATIELLSSLAGQRTSLRKTTHLDRWGRVVSSGLTQSDVPALTPAQVAHGREGYALGLDHTKTLRWIGLTPAHLTPRFTYYSERPSLSRER